MVKNQYGITALFSSLFVVVKLSARRSLMQLIDIIKLKIVILFPHLARLLLPFSSMKNKLIIFAFMVILPLDGLVTSPYGLRRNPFTQRLQFHKGVDIRAGYATLVKAVADGVVTFSGKKSGYGRVVTVNHGNGVETYYAHLGRAFVSLFDRVVKGEAVGWVGLSGRTTGTHLHFETRIDGIAVNPTGNLSSEERFFFDLRAFTLYASLLDS